MLFLARSALCIGLVAVAASDAGTGDLATALERGARDGIQGAGRACLASSDCLRAGTAALAAATASPVPIGADRGTPTPHPRAPVPKPATAHRIDGRAAPTARAPDRG